MTGGAGGMGTIAIQLAKVLCGASFVATTASPGRKTELCRSLGADVVVRLRRAFTALNLEFSALFNQNSELFTGKLSRTTI